MTTPSTGRSVSRRTALAGLGAGGLGTGGLGLALAARGHRAAARGATPGVPRGAVEPETDVAYGEAGGQELRLDVYRPPAGAAPRAAVFPFHGGA